MGWREPPLVLRADDLPQGGCPVASVQRIRELLEHAQGIIVQASAERWACSGLCHGSERDAVRLCGVHGREG